ncbi:hypothetical protein HDU84_002530 [Entophlyctis sp. JEL0112]|nr:hypothetical protein HDU84_002530 [Entophlyctis sp. JEL0112]
MPRTAHFCDLPPTEDTCHFPLRTATTVTVHPKSDAADLVIAVANLKIGNRPRMNALSHLDRPSLKSLEME